MPRKKVESKDVTPENVTTLSFFQCQELIHEIEVAAKDSEGELTDEQMEALVLAQTQAPVKLHSLCNFLKLLESKIATCKTRMAEIKESQAKAQDVLDRCGSYLAKWVEAQGVKSYHSQEYELKTRHSTSTFVPDGFDDPMFCKSETKVVVTADKKRIKEALQAGEQVPGCHLIEKINLSIK